MAKGVDAIPQQVFLVFLGNGKILFCKLNFPKIRQREAAGVGGGNPTEQKLSYVLTMKMTFNLNKFWCKVRKYKREFLKKIHDNTIKDNVRVTSSNLSQNDGRIRILTHFFARNHSKLPIEDINLIQ